MYIKSSQVFHKYISPLIQEDEFPDGKPCPLQTATWHLFDLK